MKLGNNYIFFDTLPSTNTYAQTLLRTEDVPEGTVIRAAYQTSGRGQMGNSWESDRGKNLLFSVILMPDRIEPSSQFLISMSVSLAVTDFLGKYVSDCMIKWPNDIYIRGDKIAGILIENSLMNDIIATSVAGIGINLNQKDFPADVPSATSLANITGKEYDTDECYKDLISDLDRHYSKLRQENAEIIRKNYLSRCYKLNEWNLFTDKNGKFEGRIVDVRTDGPAVIEDKKGKRREYYFKEVEFR